MRNKAKLHFAPALLVMGFLALHSMPAIAAAPQLEDALSQPYAAPEFTGIDGWINSKPVTMKALKGKVVLIDFWTYSCINCLRTLPMLKQWDATYRDQGLVIIGVHAPEFDFEKSQPNVEAAVNKFGIHYPVALDSNLSTWNAYHNQYWPAHYLIDQQGRIVYTHFGEGNYAETENNIRRLLDMNPDAKTATPQVSSSDQSPETYLGYQRSNHFVSPETVTNDQSQSFTKAASIPSDSWALSGTWRIGAEYITAEKPGATLTYHFTAGKVFLVLGTKDGKPIKAKLTLNDKPIGEAAGKDAPNGIVTIDRHRLYELVNQHSVQSGVLSITSESPGLEAYAFTFGK